MSVSHKAVQGKQPKGTGAVSVNPEKGILQ